MQPVALTTPPLRAVRLDDGMRLTYRELGAGPPIVLLHGWPTSSYLWRNVMRAIARHNCVLAVDLPGFGGSDKPLDRRYTFDLFARALDGFFDKLEVDELGLAGHDLGGPIAVHWALRNPGRVSRLALLNTLLYPEFSSAVLDFVRALSAPGSRDALTGPDGLADIMRLGLADESTLTDDVLAAVRAPFADPAARAALAAAGIGLSRRGFAEIAVGLPALDMPVRVVYGERDRVLPDVADTMARVAGDVPHAEVTALPDCGHFLQEEAPERVGELLAEFFGVGFDVRAGLGALP
ncbi:MAG TPA: alpha/beta fold hydrolase [Actinophytocola sp.]|uniref:alpha/beta fold hydrolase n=1 Tax=Actinophytocola sp. TaxID=1872138 RepID=UPI002DDDACAE|nr:alpha/beta fold hydrolase [Actinophytocola sp.]HEV2780843.1 alpha/beta fold hydrolase [Actinophytocola sp.]